MPGRKFVSGIRSGRFKFANGTAGGFLIPRVKSAALYRFYNGGENGFEVQVCLPSQNPIAAARYPVGKGCSVDLQVPANRTLKINKLNLTDDVEGVYESLDAQKDARSGRFKVAAVAAAVTTTKVIVGVSGKIYRVLNSGVNPFTVAGVANLPVPQNCSVDLFVDNTDISVVSNAVNQAIQGVYDPLSEDVVVRSGRFKTGALLRIIDFSASNGQGTQSYRVYNSSVANSFTVAGEGTVFGVVAPNNSIDIEVNSANQMIDIQTANAVEGAYEFLG